MGRTPADALREVPPHEFVQARNALAARLAKSGKTAEARRVARLRRPSPVVWALNHAATSRAHELRALVEAVDRLRRAQLGRGDPRAATEQYRTAFEPLVRGAIQVLRDAAVRVSPALDRRIRSTLLAAATDRGLRADLEAGRLAEEHADPGFAVLSGGPLPAEFLRDRPRSRAAAPARPTSAPAKSSAAESRKLAREQTRAAREAARETPSPRASVGRRAPVEQLRREDPLSAASRRGGRCRPRCDGMRGGPPQAPCRAAKDNPGRTHAHDGDLSGPGRKKYRPGTLAAVHLGFPAARHHYM